ncbi:hypothetical protein DFP72DRAFT_846011 [Ephemerocybe angulata]|uniref:Uncharacterized protein n=1 Tax=Ephemerocybe angulata TaxID=980116 RepID=A0A8H6M6X4_9AGAR|nr:hypothetical protein DFP72DRAFT_846011 [Tulosesus angulatus]
MAKEVAQKPWTDSGWGTDSVATSKPKRFQRNHSDRLHCDVESGVESTPLGPNVQSGVESPQSPLGPMSRWSVVDSPPHWESSPLGRLHRDVESVVDSPPHSNRMSSRESSALGPTPSRCRVGSRLSTPLEPTPLRCRVGSRVHPTRTDFNAMSIAITGHLMSWPTTPKYPPPPPPRTALLQNCHPSSQPSLASNDASISALTPTAPLRHHNIHPQHYHSPTTQRHLCLHHFVAFSRDGLPQHGHSESSSSTTHHIARLFVVVLSLSLASDYTHHGPHTTDRPVIPVLWLTTCIHYLAVVLRQVLAIDQREWVRVKPGSAIHITRICLPFKIHVPPRIQKPRFYEAELEQVECDIWLYPGKDYILEASGNSQIYSFCSAPAMKPREPIEPKLSYASIGYEEEEEDVVDFDNKRRRVD